MELGLQGKNILITGGSQGIGAAIAHSFLAEGANIVIVSRGSEQLFKTEAHLKSLFGEERIKVGRCDCTNSLSLFQLKSEIEKSFGQLDVVVANVGNGHSVPDPLPDEEQWNETWNNNFESALQTARVFLPMLQKSKGCLLFVSSIAAMEAFGAPVDYSTAKAAVTALAKNMARKLGGEVRVNVLAPGNVYFPGGSWDEKIKQNPERVNKMIESTVPMSRFGTPDEIADAAVFLCSERASFITGSVLVVDGGQTVGVL
jgi:3-oxoacyl-[acyl-carrier protein] reductase